MNNIDQQALESRIAAMRTQIAAEHGAMHTARLNIARWRTTPVAATPATSTMPADQVRWHAQAQQHFQHWLAEGGFARAGQASADDSDNGAASLTNAACQHAQD